MTEPQPNNLYSIATGLREDVRQMDEKVGQLIETDEERKSTIRWLKILTGTTAVSLLISLLLVIDNRLTLARVCRTVNVANSANIDTWDQTLGDPNAKNPDGSFVIADEARRQQTEDFLERIHDNFSHINC